MENSFFGKIEIECVADLEKKFYFHFTDSRDKDEGRF